ncbi:MAG: lipoyltransferase [Bacteroidaceae bacterium]|nr:lipoyltransferase [Bacteroidaceae bacterium]
MSDALSSSLFPACFVSFPSQSVAQRSASFFLAAEEYVAKHFPAGSYFFLWRTQPTVVVGRNQTIEQEVNVAFCREQGIEIVRRKSGGGCIYSDGNNVMLSLITPAGSVEPIFRAYAERIAHALTELGAKADVSGRNDIVLADGRKVCGNAFYHLPERNIVHGTMLYDVDVETMVRAITPSSDKLKMKGTESVRSRVGSLKEYINMSIEQLQMALRAALCDREVLLSEEDLHEVEEIEKTYRRADFLHKQSGKGTFQNELYIDGCGSVKLLITLKERLIKELVLSGDFFEVGDTQKVFQQAFEGTEWDSAAIQNAIETYHPEKTVRGLTEKHLWKLFDFI